MAATLRNLLRAGFCGLLLAWLGLVPALAASAGLDNPGCLRCHESKQPGIKVADEAEGQRALKQLDTLRFAKGVHAQMQCVSCHTDIVDSQANHRKNPAGKRPDCVTCHQGLWASAQQQGRSEEKKSLWAVVRNIEDYQRSFHARPDADDPGRPKATCEQCHASHDFNVPPKGSERRTAWHKDIPQTCGAQCHEDQLEAFAASIHGEAVLDNGNPKAAVCTDCHTAHQVVNTSTDAFKLSNVDTCGGCHKEALASYSDTYHGQVNRLGYTYTARCIDCHDSHGIRANDDPKSKVHPNNRMKTCTKCHNDDKPGMRKATAGFASFGPHANVHDFGKYPQMFVASKFMVALLIGVFAFFWLHSGLWYFREWRDRREGRPRARIDTRGLQLDPKKHVRRFAAGWRVAHLAFALATMTLVLTGTTALFAQSAWAPVVASAFGGPKTLGLVHRVAAMLFVGIFVIHFVYVMQKLLRDRSFRWFGPDSLLPNWQDFADCWAMFKWFFGQGPRPLFDRWAYYEKFDYWAVFWGVNVIGWSGLMLAFPHVTATYLPGWVFNVATLVHGEEAFLAAVFLFTVHFFNNHFRPDKLPPPDVVMFTGTQSLEEFRHDHPAHYQRLIDLGELEKHLVDAPSPRFRTGSVVLGLILIACGLVLLVLVLNGFLSGLGRA